MGSPKVYRSYDDFARDELRPAEKPHFSIEEFVDEIFLEDDFEFEFNDGEETQELDFDE
jgi:hypothetical protein